MPPKGKKGKGSGAGTKRTASKREEEEHDLAPTDEQKQDGVDASPAREGSKKTDHEEKQSSGSKSKKARKTEETTSKADKALEWLLSDEAWDLSHPEIGQGYGEQDWADEERRKTPPPEAAAKHPRKKKAGKGEEEEELTYPNVKLTPIQLLICSVLLSKPLSHRLGLRTIKTIFNPPFTLRNAKDLDLAGYETRRKAMWEARTQHKEKTAAQLGDMVEGIRKVCGGKDSGIEVDMLEQVRKDAAGDPDKVKKILASNIKGVGPTGIDIFLRGVQVQWKEFYPFADGRLLKDAAAFGLISEEDAKDVKKGAKALAERVAKGGKVLDEEGGEALAQRERFVKLLEVLIGLDLEKKTEEARERIAAEA